MAIYKNVASQKIAVFAWDTVNDVPKTGDAANITAEISLDGGASAATNDVNPTELDATDHPGIYIFDLTQAETNADMVLISPVSGTADIVLEPLMILTLPGTNAALTANVTQLGGVSQSLTDLKHFADSGYDPSTSKVQGVVLVDTLDGHTAQTGDTFALANGVDGFVAIATDTGAILLDTDELQTDWVNGGRLDLLVDAIKAITDQFVFTVANQVDANALSGGGGLDAAGVRSAVGLAAANLDTQLGNIPTVSEFNARTLAAADYFDPAADTVANVTLVGTLTTYTGNTPQTGDTFALANGATGFVAIDTVVDAIKAITDQFVFTVANQVDANALSGGSGLDAAGVRAAVGLGSANLDTQLADIPTVSEFNARTLAAADYFDPAADTVANVTLVATTTNLTNLPAITANWLTAAGLAADAVAEIQSGLATAANLSTVAGYIDTEIGTIITHLTDIKGATWSAVTDTLEGIRDRGDSAWITATGFATATNVTDAQAAIITQVDANETKIDALVATVGANGAGLSAIPKTGYKLAADGADLILIDGRDLPNALEIIGAVVAGKVSGAGTGTEVFVGLDDSTTRATVTVDTSGNRTLVTKV